MPADERATLRGTAIAITDAYEARIGSQLYDVWPLREAIEKALKEADRLAREDAATITDEMVEAAARAMWDSEPVIYAWGPQERHRFSWDEGVKRGLAGVPIFRQFARAALEAAIRASITTDEGADDVDKALAFDMLTARSGRIKALEADVARLTERCDAYNKALEKLDAATYARHRMNNLRAWDVEVIIEACERHKARCLATPRAKTT